VLSQDVVSRYPGDVSLPDETTGTGDSPPATVDGRRARRERGRQAVLDAVIDLLSEGRTSLTAGEVTARAGISEATLFRYFQTLDELQHEATTRYFERYATLFDVPDLGVGTLEDRAQGLASARVDLYETIAPIARFGRARAVDHPHLAETLHAARLRQQTQVRHHFEQELRGLSPSSEDDAVSLISTITSFESWEQQRRDLDRSGPQVRRSWRHAIVALLG
jgi:AcrR family transcriptional regulator